MNRLTPLLLLFVSCGGDQEHELAEEPETVEVTAIEHEEAGQKPIINNPQSSDCGIRLDLPDGWTAEPPTQLEVYLAEQAKKKKLQESKGER